MHKCVIDGKPIDGMSVRVFVDRMPVRGFMCIDHGRNGGNNLTRSRYDQLVNPIAYTGQCVGGPDNGNLVTSSRPVWILKAVFTRWLDGEEEPHPQSIEGTYVWQHETATFKWQGGV